MTHLFTIQEDTVVIDKLAVSKINSDVTITGNTTACGSVNIRGDLQTTNITTGTLRVKELISETTDFGNWAAKTFDELNGKGITWTCNEGATQLIYRTGNRIWTSSNVDIAAESTYMIDSIPVLSSYALGQSVTKSNLRQVGALNALSVIGAASISGFAYFDDNTSRLGLGTSEPNASISIVDNNVEISIGSPAYNLATIGTYSNHDLAIITDNTPRIIIKQSGEIQISDEVSKSGVLRVFGSIYADSIVTDTRVTRSSSLEFNETKESSIYDKGLIWKTESSLKQLVLVNDPSRLWSSESFDIGFGKSYYINGNAVISETSLGEKIINSNLVTVGNLKSLTVDGDITVNGNVSFNNPLSLTSLEVSELSSPNTLTVNASNTDILYANDTEIIIGSKQQPRRPLKVFGTLSIGVTNPDPLVSFSVNGNVSFNNKKFMNGVSIPTSGEFAKGDIVWSENPIEDGYVGWVCIRSGTPGEWKPFGALGA